MCVDIYSGANQLWTQTIGGYLELKYVTPKEKIEGLEIKV